jgi:pimeloyl-ACP methyl ester carboxylesterase
VDRPAAVRRLVLESPSAGIADPAGRAARAAEDEALAARIERDGIGPFVDTWWATTPVFASERTLPAPVRARLRAARLRNTAAGLAGSLRGAGQGAMTPLHDALPRIAALTLVIAGELDPIGARRAGEVAAAIPHARLAVVPGAGHAPHRETPAAFRRLITPFLQEEPAA